MVRVSVQFEKLAPASVSTSSRPAGVAAPRRTGPSLTGVVKAILFSGLSPEAEQKIRERLPIHEGDRVSSGDMTRAFASSQIRDIDEHIELSEGWSNVRDSPEVTYTFFIKGAPVPALGRAIVRFTPSDGRSVVPVEPTTPQASPGGVQPQQPIRVGGNAQQANLVRRVTPAYPPLAKQARIQGTVRLSATINKDGTVQSLDVIDGHPLLVDAAMDAVKQWLYKPTLLNGNPVEVITQIDVNFTLSQ